jgi:DNA-binding CsgD family transcriptional regulator
MARSSDHVGRVLERLAVDAGDHHEFWKQAEEVLRSAIGYEVASWGSMDPTTLLFTSCDVFVAGARLPHDPSRENTMLGLEFAGRDPLTYLSMVREGRLVGRLRADVADVESVERYRAVIAPMGGHDEMRMVLRDKTGVWGALAFGRSDGEFRDDEAEFAAALTGTLAGAFRHAFLASAASGHGEIDRPPGSLTLDQEGHVVATSEPAERWLDTLANGQTNGVLASLTQKVKSDPLARLTVAGSEGPVTFHAFPSKGVGDEVDVIVERPRELQLAEIIMRAHGLTPREAEVTRWVMSGATTRQIGNGLGVSEYTVQDHLKSVFAKVGVATRGELQSTIYARHYVPRRERDAVPGPYGWFLDD